MSLSFRLPQPVTISWAARLREIVTLVMSVVNVATDSDQALPCIALARAGI
jgi:hypothetical protein